MSREKELRENMEVQTKDIGIKCYCGSSTKYYPARQLFKCNKIGEWVVFYPKHSCLVS